MQSIHEYHLLPIWFDIIWFGFVLLISPALFLLTIFLTELPVVVVRRVCHVLRLKFDAN